MGAEHSHTPASTPRRRLIIAFAITSTVFVTEVVGAAVESVSPAGTPTEATALVYTNSVSTSPVTKNIPSLRYLSYRLTLKRDGGDWRITQMPALTKLDLSPQL